MTKAEALAEYLGVEVESVVVSEFDDSLFETNGRTIHPIDYLVLTDEEADAEARDRILDLLWAFDPNFLSDHLKISQKSALAVIAALQAQYDEGNDALVELVEDKELLVNEAIGADGRGHFLSGYDGVEIECGGYFMYRQ